MKTKNAALRQTVSRTKRRLGELQPLLGAVRAGTKYVRAHDTNKSARTERRGRAEVCVRARPLYLRSR